VAWLGICACGAPRESQSVQAVYDKETGKLKELAVNTLKDGRPDVFSYMDGGRVIRIEIDNDEDGRLDRWEYYGTDQKMLKVGLSRGNDGKPDVWMFQGPEGSVEKVEVSTRRDGKANRTEFYENGMVARAEEDGDGDGQVDKWEIYERGALARVSFDTTKSGKPTQTIDYSGKKPITISPSGSDRP
jgi:hypothetical protein